VRQLKYCAALLTAMFIGPQIALAGNCDALASILSSGKGGYVQLRLSKIDARRNQLRRWNAKSTFAPTCYVEEYDDRFQYGCKSDSMLSDDARAASVKFANEAYDCMEHGVWKRKETTFEDEYSITDLITLSSVSDDSQVYTGAYTDKADQSESYVTFTFKVPKH